MPKSYLNFLLYLCKVALPKGKETETKEQIKERLKSAKLDQEARGWIDAIRRDASIKYFVKY